MAERIRFIDHQGKKILLVDLSNLPPGEFEKLVRQVPDYVTVQPRGSRPGAHRFHGSGI